MKKHSRQGRTVASLVNYDKALEAYSRGMIAEALNNAHSGEPTTYLDGVVSDFEFSGSDILSPAGAYRI